MKNFENFTSHNEDLPEKEKIEELHNLIREKLDHILSPCVAGRFGDDHFSFDAASYYTLVDLSNDKSELVKLGWGEMSSNTFLSAKEDLLYPDVNGLIREIPVPIYCLTQGDSYLSDDNTLQKIANNPKDYLKDKAVFVYEKDGVGFVGNEPIDKNGPQYRRELKLENLPAVSVDEAISKMKQFNI
ncbi:MAG: hypothetical protein K9M44_04595 [Candidatus Pacebacteria bacterium]|nr:hypothetical protein [Candidatus Paceibacterota bacterium]